MTEEISRPRMAQVLATFVHRGQKYGTKSYMAHLEEVAELVRDWGDNAVVTAYLHDSIEDTQLSISTIDDLFGEFVSEAVGYLTDPPYATRKQRKAAAYAVLASLQYNGESQTGLSSAALALVVKAADRVANVRACIRDKKDSMLEMYRKEHQEFYTAVYRPGLNEDFIHELNERFQ